MLKIGMFIMAVTLILLIDINPKIWSCDGSLLPKYVNLTLNRTVASFKSNGNRSESPIVSEFENSSLLLPTLMAQNATSTTETSVMSITNATTTEESLRSSSGWNTSNSTSKISSSSSTSFLSTTTTPIPKLLMEKRNNFLNTTYRVKTKFNQQNQTTFDGKLNPEVLRNDSHIKILTILGLFELTKNGKPRPDGKSEKYAAEMAINDINRRQLLKNYHLVLQTNDTQCDAGVGVDAFFHALYANNDKRIISLIGTACSEVTERLAKVVEYWNMVQISFGSTSPSLSDRKEFPLFFRTVSVSVSHCEALIALIQHFHWDTVTFFTYNENQYTLPANYLLNEFEKVNITCKATLTFSLSDIRDQLQHMKDLDSRIIIASFSSEMAPAIFCEVYRLGMFGSEYVWILIGKPETSWWLKTEPYYYYYSTTTATTAASTSSFSNAFTTTSSSLLGYLSTPLSFSSSSQNSQSNSYETVNEPFKTRRKSNNRIKNNNHKIHWPWNKNDDDENFCSPKELKEVVEYSLIVDRHNYIIKNMSSISGMKASNFRAKFYRRQLPESPFAPETYDAVWSLALALKSVRETHNLSLESFEYNDTNFSTKLMEELSELLFAGISGPVSFDGADRIGVTSFMQIIDGEMRQVGLYFPRDSLLQLNNDNCSTCSPIVWPRNQVPIARREFRFKIIQVENSLYIIVAILASTGILIALGFLSFNLYNRKLKYIKLSSPKLNNIMIFGCIFAYLAVILLGSDVGFEPDLQLFDYMCSIRAYLLSTGFSLAFGAMFAKTYRVHRIFTRSCAGVVKNKLLKDRQLMTLILALFLIDCFIVSTWSLFDPMHRKLQNLTLEIDPSDRTVVYQNQFEVCVSDHGHIWLSILYGYKGLLLVVGLYMAWETRHVKIQALNDSKYIGICVYIVVLTSILAVSLANLISERVTISFLSVTSLILTSTTMTLCLLFLPKIRAVVQKRNVGDPIVASLGLKIEFNTRRFMIEDSKELHFRAEVQNRVFKRQIELIDAEIWKTEKLLLNTTATTEQCNNNVRKVSVASIPAAGTGTALVTDAHQQQQTSSKKPEPLLPLLLESSSSSKGLQDLAEKIQNQAISVISKPKQNIKPNNNTTLEETGAIVSSSSSEEEESSSSEIYTVYLHRPRFIIPISLFGLRNYISTTPNNNNTSNNNNNNNNRRTILSSIAAIAASALRSSNNRSSTTEESSPKNLNTNVSNNKSTTTALRDPRQSWPNSNSSYKSQIQRVPQKCKFSSSEPKLFEQSESDFETRLSNAIAASEKASSSEGIKSFSSNVAAVSKNFVKKESLTESGESNSNKGRKLKSFLKSPLNVMSGLFNLSTRTTTVPKFTEATFNNLPAKSCVETQTRTQQLKYNSVPNLWIVNNSPILESPSRPIKRKHTSFCVAGDTGTGTIAEYIPPVTATPSFEDGGSASATTAGDSLPSHYSCSSGNVSLIEEDIALKLYSSNTEFPHF